MASMTLSRVISAVVGTNGSVTQTVQQTAANGSLLSKVVTTRSADGKTINETADTDGDGVADHITAIQYQCRRLPEQRGRQRSERGRVSRFQGHSAHVSRRTSHKRRDIDADGDGTFELVIVAVNHGQCRRQQD